ncbi:Zinc finger protein 277 [Araneus ventricosus]|uniref:Zinc finger protein 277 n=1 Tax=Araneus ventricosus TaxID=182803 RepID=A0A4Y2NJE5_ARAVE|nr:Zinc finger protein 277 [Araneus ventricosus]GBN40375.1 Zinc finger protein 277 [Araneus ventricosus]
MVYCLITDGETNFQKGCQLKRCRSLDDTLINEENHLKKAANISTPAPSTSRPNVTSKNSSVVIRESFTLNSICLFCDHTLPGSEDIFMHMAYAHGFNFPDLVRSYNLDVYQQFRLINFIRHASLNLKCYVCNDQFSSKKNLRKHLKVSNHGTIIPRMDIWDQWIYMKSPLGNDPLLNAFVDKYT